MMERAEFVRHRVAYSEECVCESHARHSRGVCHFFTRKHVGLSVVVSARQIFENGFQRFERKTVGVIGRHHRRVRFQRVSYGVDTACGGKSARRAHMEIRVDNCHFGQKFVVGKGIFHARFFIGNNRKRGNFAARARRRRDCDEVRFFAHLREGVNTLSDVHETHCHIHKVGFGVFVQNPHNLAGVHCRAAAERDNAVGFERSHLRRAFFCTGKRRIGSNVEERRMNDAHLIEFIGDRLRIAVVVKETVGNDKRPFLSHYRL